MAVLLDGDAFAARCRAEIKARAERSEFVRNGNRPCLATILVGEDPASRDYVSRKHGDCRELGFHSRQIEMPASTQRRELLDAVETLNRDPSCHGLLVQLPLPPHLDPAEIQEAVDPAKDVDGLHLLNLGRMMTGRPGLRPCTPKAIIGLLQAHGVPLAGRRVAVIGRGLLVGRPLAIMLAAPGVDAAPTLLHRGSGDPAPILRESDVIVAAAGQPDLVQAGMVKPGACVVGVGISYCDGQMVSDIADDVAGVAGFVTPRHGSVGAVTRAMLMSNLLDAALSSA
ncbi:MAG: bifunctional 5,10-methylenetetrahydrofolate dehydrogenase/5,10-methenyltetrahydrofolate cyclohydrolase [Novosphingobium sp.]